MLSPALTVLLEIRSAGIVLNRSWTPRPIETMRGCWRTVPLLVTDIAAIGKFPDLRMQDEIEV